MKKKIDLVLSPEEAAREEMLRDRAARSLGIEGSTISRVKPLRRSIDARGGKVRIILAVEVTYGEDAPPDEVLRPPRYPSVAGGTPLIIVGSGPAGLFAALRAVELGMRPIILERGKDVRARRKDIVAITRRHIVNPESNYCFGEGGAGAYSDGKLYTRAGKRGDTERILKTFVSHGAPGDILVDTRPHIGTNRLPRIIVSMRESILKAGGEIHCNTLVTDLVVGHGAVEGVLTRDGVFIEGKKVILATGHSARDVFHLLLRKGILIEAKPFALGVRVEHPQSLIDSIQYSCQKRDIHLPPASYSLVEEVKGRGVYSFCMCPGGMIAPCATGPEEVVTNGWSPSGKNFPFANSGIVVTVGPEDLKPFGHSGPLSALAYQRHVERAAWEAGGRSQTVPAQRLVDFVEDRLSPTLPVTSYRPGTKSAQLSQVLPPEVYECLREGFRRFGKRMRGYYTNEAVVHAVESRTSSPVRIPRDAKTLEHPQVRGLYPCGEGAGHAGGIVSAAIDGVRCAEKCAPC